MRMDWRKVFLSAYKHEYWWFCIDCGAEFKSYRWKIWSAVCEIEKELANGT